MMDAMRFMQSLNAALPAALVSLSLCTASAAAPPTELFERYGDGGRHFDEIEIANMLVYFHQRTLGSATVEKDYIVYQVGKDTGELSARKSHWRNDLADLTFGALLSREQAEVLVEGEIQFSRLYIISPESNVFPLDPTPANPCWAVRSVGEYGECAVTIVDALCGTVLGEGVPPPYTAFSLTGPQYNSPCSGVWDDWAESAQWWFMEMGYPTEEVEWPTEAKVKSHIQSDETAMFYELAHGTSLRFASGCLQGDSYEYTYAYEIEMWMDGYEKMPFAFIGSCDGLCSTGYGTLAYAFCKGSYQDTAVVGYCGMSDPECDDCWTYSVDWQDALFHYMSIGCAVRDAYFLANADYPACANWGCMRFAGDPDFAVVPRVPRSICSADFDQDGDVDTADLLHLLGAWGTSDGDADGDGDTDTADLLVLLGAWGYCPGMPPCPWDFTGDGVVDDYDLIVLLEHWGDCPDPPAVCPWDLTGDGVVGPDDHSELTDHYGPCP